MKGKKLTAEETEQKLEAEAGFRREVFKQLLQHIVDGYSIDCFPQIDETTIHSYIQRYPNEFVAKELVKACRSAKKAWEDIGTRQSNGTCLGNSRSWVYNMINRYGWTDKLKVESKGEQQINVNIVSYSKSKSST